MSQQRCVGEHAGAHVAAVQRLPLHIGVSATQTVPQPPQLYGSFVGLTHAPLQQVRPFVHPPPALHGPPPLSGAPASWPPLDELLEEDELLDPPELDPPESTDASVPPIVVDEPPQWKAATVTESTPDKTRTRMASVYAPRTARAARTPGASVTPGPGWQPLDPRKRPSTGVAARANGRAGRIRII
jgi:hypothetical protein